MLRLHNYPDELAAPLQMGDAVVIWSPHRDAGDMTMRDRSTANAVTVRRPRRAAAARRRRAAVTFLFPARVRRRGPDSNVR